MQPMREEVKHQNGGAPPPAPTVPRVTDPVCGMSVSGDSPHRYRLGSREFVFCSAHCRDRFAQAPTAFVSPLTQAPGAQIGEAIYTCPMHPEVRQPGPATCPKCGMALEPISGAPAAPPTEWVCPMHPEIVRARPGPCPICGMALEPRVAGEEENPELRDMSRRFWFAAALTLPLVLGAVGDLLPGAPISRVVSMRTRTLIELALATPVCLWAAWPFYVRAVLSVMT